MTDTDKYNLENLLPLLMELDREDQDKLKQLLYSFAEAYLHEEPVVAVFVDDEQHTIRTHVFHMEQEEFEDIVVSIATSIVGHDSDHAAPESLQ